MNDTTCITDGAYPNSSGSIKNIHFEKVLESTTGSITEVDSFITSGTLLHEAQH